MNRRLGRALRALKKRFVSTAGELSYGLWSQESPVFVLSTGRTGTDTLHHLFRLSPGVISLHEPKPRLLPERQKAYQSILNSSKEFQKILKAARGYALLSAKLSGKTYIETSARMTFMAPAIRSILPNARFIFMHRHPADIVRSGMRRGWYQGHPADRFRIEPRPEETIIADWPRMSPFERICWYWSAYNRFALDFLAGIPPEKWISVESQLLFEGKPELLGSLFRLIGVDMPNPSEIGKLLGKKINAQQEDAFPRFDQWTSQQREILFQIAGREIQELGYGNGFPVEASDAGERHDRTYFGSI